MLKPKRVRANALGLEGVQAFMLRCTQTHFFFALQDTNANKKNQRNVNNSLESVFRYAKICMVEITGEGLNPLRFEISQEVLECLQTAKASASQPAKDRVLQEFWHVGSSNKIFQVCMRLSRVINLMSDKTTVVVLIVLK